MGTGYAVEDIFRPKSFPIHTYVNRSFGAHGDTYEKKLQKALRNTGSLISITGASKSGKTVLCHKVIPTEKIIDLSGAQIQSQQDFWNQIAEKLGVPNEVQTIQDAQQTLDMKGKAGGKGKIPFLASADASVEIGSAHTTGTHVQQTVVRSNSAIMQYIIQQDKVIVIDDFHYIDEAVQLYIARTLKTELFNGLKAVLLSLPHRADDAVRLNPDLIGRTTFIDIAAWTLDELKEIARKGFELLHYDISEEELNILSRESIASPQLMQENCFNLADCMDAEKETRVTGALVTAAFHETVENYSHYDDILKQVLQGPAQGRSKRKKFSLNTGAATDIYHLLLVSLSIDPPVLSMTLEDICERFRQLLTEKEKLPQPLAIANAVAHIEKIMKEAVPKLDTIEWRTRTLYILDPFLLFYLRWGTEWKRG